MTVSIPLSILFAALVYIAWRYMGLRIWHLAVCLVLGVLLAGTSAGPDINNALTELARWLTQTVERR